MVYLSFQKHSETLLSKSLHMTFVWILMTWFFWLNLEVENDYLSDKNKT